MLLTHRKLLQSKAIAIENDLRATLRNFGLKVGVVGTVKFDARIRKLVVALTFRVTVDAPARFRNSKAVGAVFGLTPSKYQSGESDRTGGISRCGDEMMRAMLYEATQILFVRSAKWSWLKAWAMPSR
jgi:transposase